MLKFEQVFLLKHVKQFNLHGGRTGPRHVCRNSVQMAPKHVKRFYVFEWALKQT